VSSGAFHEKLALKVDASKARARLGWRQLLRLEQALGWTVDWYKQHLTGSPALPLTEKQIDDYGKLGVTP
jgi:CDP-glucose 4,6-dehydratase